MSDFASFLEKQMNVSFGDTLFDDFTHKELVPLSHIREKDSSWILEMDLPLVDKKDIDVILSENHLTIKAKLKKTFCVTRGSIITEFGYFRKTIPLPKGINMKEISAEFKNGILKIIMPKLATGKKIPIE